MTRCLTLALIAALTLALNSCSDGEAVTEQENETASPVVYGADLPATDLVSRLNIFVDDDLAAELENNTKENGYVEIPEVKSLAANGILRMRRLFRDAGEFEARTRAEGLHKWYLVEYDESQSMTKAVYDLHIPGVERIEYVPKIHISGDPQVITRESGQSVTKASSSMPFDDPRLEDQWHYYNNGSASSSVSGCDINVFPVWKNYTAGSSEVIVSVVDGGIDFNHEDLADNMWINSEKKGDNRFGYNFVTDTYTVTPEDHGTHVAGTIAAINNNGKGVCGIAGGNAAEGIKGVKLMSCQIFSGDNSGSGPEAIKWGADHGAVISQNSWGYTDINYTPAALKSAVDYFIKYAGIDAAGNQTGPMKGGIVIFAAGNDSRDYSGSEYESIVNVAAVGADYRKSYYTNYGDWVDIAAPGGDAKKGNQILSTLPDNKYGRMQGTSMACPHVSGVAALIVSQHGGTGFTSTALKKRLLENVTDISSFNGSYSLGAGLVNAYRSIAGSGGVSPDMPTDLKASASSNNINFSVTVPSDSDDGIPTTIQIYYSESSFSSADGIMFGSFYTDGMKAGQTLTGTISGLEFNTDYYVAARAVDLAGNTSSLTSRLNVTTGGNTAPVITAISSTEVSIKAHESAVLNFTAEDPDGHYFDVALDAGSDAAVLDTLDKSAPKIRITGADAPEGKYRAVMTVTDYYGLAATAEVNYTIQQNTPPYIGEKIGDRIFNSLSAGTLTMTATDYFKDDDGEELSYAVTISNPSVVNMTYSKGSFLLTPMNYGNADISVEGTDIRGEKVSQSFRVLVRNSSSPVDIYPNPVRTYLYVRTSEDCMASLKISGASGGIFFEDNLEITPFSPAKIDMRDASPGVYAVTLNMDGKELKYTVVKI